MFMDATITFDRGDGSDPELFNVPASTRSVKARGLYNCHVCQQQHASIHSVILMEHGQEPGKAPYIGIQHPVEHGVWNVILHDCGLKPQNGKISKEYVAKLDTVDITLTTVTFALCHGCFRQIQTEYGTDT